MRFFCFLDKGFFHCIPLKVIKCKFKNDHNLMPIKDHEIPHKGFSPTLFFSNIIEWGKIPVGFLSKNYNLFLLSDISFTVGDVL